MVPDVAVREGTAQLISKGGAGDFRREGGSRCVRDRGFSVSHS